MISRRSSVVPAIAHITFEIATIASTLQVILSLFSLDVRGDGGDGGDRNDDCSESLILICNICQLNVAFT